jgi:pimeloyl-ACP methyl ester carboxylesterase
VFNDVGMLIGEPSGLPLWPGCGVRLFRPDVSGARRGTLVASNGSDGRVKQHEVRKVKHSAEITTTAVGGVEVETHGSGTPVIVIHGSPGGADAARAMSRFLTEEGIEAICVSRPGYLGTPLDSTDPSIDRESDLLAAVLDAVGVERAGVLAWSGGGPAAYRLAVRHPDRVSAIVAIAAVSSRWVAPKPALPQRFMFGTAAGERLVNLLARWAPERVVEGALSGEGSVRGAELRTLTEQVMARPAQRRLVLEVAATVNTAGKRQAGWRNDVANFARIDSLDLDRVQCPVLLVHGDADTDASITYSRSAHAELPDSTLIVMERGTHLAFYAHPEASETQERARRWFSEST